MTLAEVEAKYPRTICADCRWYKTRESGFGYPRLTAVCGHESARHLVSGEPSDCASRNDGACKDFERKPCGQPASAASAAITTRIST
jgi:hypothetical protein